MSSLAHAESKLGRDKAHLCYEVFWVPAFAGMTSVYAASEQFNFNVTPAKAGAQNTAPARCVTGFALT